MGLSVDESKQNLEQRQHSTPYGFDHNYIVRKQAGLSLPKVASLRCKSRSLSIYSDAPGVQVYTANYLSKENQTDSVCKKAYGPWSAICLETQHFPDSIICSYLNDNDVDVIDKLFYEGKCPILSIQNPVYRQTIAYHFEVDYPNAEQRYHGSDTEGNTYNSIEEMWNHQDLSCWYSRAKQWYEENCESTVDGVLGGIGYISNDDLQGSHDFLNQLHLPSCEPSVACEMGAGIGRVSKGLLLDFVDHCDLVESSSRLLSAAPDYIGGDLCHRCRFYCSELQDFQPLAKRYSIIWIQWVLCYLTDKDIVNFLMRCSESLVDGGWIILKENTCTDEAFVVDVADASITRSLDYWLDLVAKSGLHVRHMHWQEKFPDDIFPVPMIALQR
jgi:protein N-terminal methyltransferase